MSRYADSPWEGESKGFKESDYCPRGLVRGRIHVVALERGIRKVAGSFRKFERKSLGNMGGQAEEDRKQGIKKLRPKSMGGHWVEPLVSVSLVPEPLGWLLCPGSYQRMCSYTSPSG